MITFFYLIIFVIIFLLAAVVKAGTEATKIGEGVKGQQAPPKKRGGGLALQYCGSGDNPLELTNRSCQKEGHISDTAVPIHFNK